MRIGPFLLASLLAFPLAAAERSADVDKAVLDILGKSGAPSASVAIVQDGRLAYSQDVTVEEILNDWQQALERAKSIFAGLQRGKIDRSLFTSNANAYFSEQAVGDFASTLRPFGAPTRAVHRDGGVTSSFPTMTTLRTAVFLSVMATIASAQETAIRRRAVPRIPPAQEQSVRACSTDICTTSQPHACIEVTNAETAWRTCISNQGRRGLVLGPTDLRRTPTSDWMRVLREAGVAEIFVPYHGLGLRLYDHETTSAQSILEVTSADAGPNGTVLTLSGQRIPQVVVETNDRGIAWLCKERRSNSRRGQELVLWGVQDAANYDFIIEYRLRDDGSIGFRLGATGYNNPFFPPRSTTEAHMHDVLWRVDVDLNGSGNDTAVQLTHVETSNPRVTRDDEAPFNGGREGVMKWDPEKFFTIGVEDTTVNAHGNRIGYALRPSASGISRHFGSVPREEKFTQSDFAVTRFKQAERDALYDSAHVRYLQPDQYLLGQDFEGSGVADNESIENSDVVLWYRSSAHHDPHDEDHAPGDPSSLMTGITNVHWQGVDLEPRNLFDFNPLGGPSRTNCQ